MFQLCIFPPQKSRVKALVFIISDVVRLQITAFRRRIRTTNLIERAFVEQRRRTKIIPRFWDERSCLKLVFATLWQASERWQRVRMTDLELAMLRRLRRELALEPNTPEPTSFQKKAV